jgi:transposase
MGGLEGLGLDHGLESAMSWRNGQAYSQDLRDRVVALLDEGIGAYEVAETLRVGVTYVYRVRRAAAAGQVTAAARGGGVVSPLRALDEAITARMGETPDMTIMELRAWLLAAHGVSASVGAAWAALRRLGLTYKKKSCGRPSGSAPASREPGRLGGRARRSLPLAA